MDHVGVVVDDLAAATAFFVALGLEVLGEWSVDDPAAGRIIGLEGVHADVAMLGAPDASGKLELSHFHAPRGGNGDPHAASNTPGLRHVTFEVDDLDAAVAAVQAHGGELVGEVEQFGNTYRLCYVRGPEGIIVELAETVG